MPYGAHYEEDMSRLHIHVTAPATDDIVEATGSEIPHDSIEEQVPAPENYDHSKGSRPFWIGAFIM